jgi:hypothetical protein
MQRELPRRRVTGMFADGRCGVRGHGADRTPWRFLVARQSWLTAGDQKKAGTVRFPLGASRMNDLERQAAAAAMALTRAVRRDTLRLAVFL